MHGKQEGIGAMVNHPAACVVHAFWLARQLRAGMVMLDPVKPGEQLGHRQVQLGRDVLVDIHLRQ